MLPIIINRYTVLGGSDVNILINYTWNVFINKERKMANILYTVVKFTTSESLYLIIRDVFIELLGETALSIWEFHGSRFSRILNNYDIFNLTLNGY